MLPSTLFHHLAVQYSLKLCLCFYWKTFLCTKSNPLTCCKLSVEDCSNPAIWLGKLELFKVLWKIKGIYIWTIVGSLAIITPNKFPMGLFLLQHTLKSISGNYNSTFPQENSMYLVLSLFNVEGYKLLFEVQRREEKLHIFNILLYLVNEYRILCHHHKDIYWNQLEVKWIYIMWYFLR